MRISAVGECAKECNLAQQKKKSNNVKCIRRYDSFFNKNLSQNTLNEIKRIRRISLVGGNCEGHKIEPISQDFDPDKKEQILSYSLERMGWQKILSRYCPFNSQRRTKWPIRRFYVYEGLACDQS